MKTAITLAILAILVTGCSKAGNDTSLAGAAASTSNASKTTPLPKGKVTPLFTTKATGKLSTSHKKD